MCNDMCEFTQSLAVRCQEESRHTITVNSTTTTTTMPPNRLVADTTTSGTNIQIWTIYSPTRLALSVTRPAGLIANCLDVRSRPSAPNRLQILPAKLILD